MTEQLDKELLSSCECVGKSNNVSREERIDVLHDMIFNVVKECSKILTLSKNMLALIFVGVKNLVSLNRRH